MTEQQRVSALWDILREDYGIETMEQFLAEYRKLLPLDISAFGEAPPYFTKISDCQLQ